MRVLSRLLVAVMLVAGFSRLAVAAQPSATGPRAPAPAPVKTVSPVATPSTAASTVRVVIAAPREAKLAAPMAGRLIDLPRKAGEAFGKGDTLAGFDCAVQRAELAMADARLEKANRQLDSQASLNKLNAASDLDVAMARADVAEAKARRQQTDVLVQRCVIAAPYAGRVVRRIANQFETLSIGDPVLEVVESGALRLELLVPSRWLGWIRAGSGFVVNVDELGRKVPARITALGARVDPVSQTVTAQAVFTENVPGVLPGMSGSAVFDAPAAVRGAVP